MSASSSTEFTSARTVQKISELKLIRDHTLYASFMVWLVVL